jgi:hypothetical protein
MNERPYPDDFSSWPQGKRDEFFAQSAKHYAARDAASSTLAGNGRSQNLSLTT